MEKIKYYTETPTIVEEKKRLKLIVSTIKENNNDIKQFGYKWVLDSEDLAKFFVDHLTTPMTNLDFEAIASFLRAQPSHSDNVLWTYEYLHIALDENNWK